jgi:hypothetical protein
VSVFGAHFPSFLEPALLPLQYIDPISVILPLRQSIVNTEYISVRLFERQKNIFQKLSSSQKYCESSIHIFFLNYFIVSCQPDGPDAL